MPSQISWTTRSLRPKKPCKINLQSGPTTLRNTLMVTGVNDSSKEDKFVSMTYKLVQREHLTDKDKEPNPHARRFGEKNSLKVGDKVRLGPISTMLTMKRANETVEVTIKGLFSGKNQAPPNLRPRVV